MPNILLRRGTASQWTTSNRVLLPGEVGVELDSGKFKVGDGATPWNSLVYASAVESVSDDAYDAEVWESGVAVSPSQKAVRDKFVAVDTVLGGKADSADLGSAAERDTGNLEGQIPLLEAGGKLPVAILPELSLTSSKSVGNESIPGSGQAARLALSEADAKGFAVLDSDTGKTWMLTQAPWIGSSGEWDALDWLQLGDRDISWADVNKTGALPSDIGAATAAQGAKADTALQPVLTVKPFSRIAFVGDSITDAMGTTPLSLNITHAGVALCRSKGQLSLVSNPTTGRPSFAASGKATLAIHRYFTEKLCLSTAQAVVILAGTNDYSLGTTPAQTVANLALMVDAYIAAGKTPVVCEILPVPSTHGTGSPGKPAWIVATNALLPAMMASRPQALLCQWAYVLDSNNDGLADTDNYFSDSVHPDADGNLILGNKLWETLAPYVIASDYFAGIQYLNPNPKMSGTLGANNLATGWLSWTDPAKPAAYSLIARGGDLGNWQQITMTGDASKNSDFQYSYGTSSGFGTGSDMWAVGDEVEFFCEFETGNDLSPLFSVSPRFSSTVSGSTAIRINPFAGGGGSFTNFERMPSGVYVAGPYVIPSGTTSIWPNIQISGTGTLRIGRCGIRRRL